MQVYHKNHLGGSLANGFLFRERSSESTLKDGPHLGSECERQAASFLCTYHSTMYRRELKEQFVQKRK